MEIPPKTTTNPGTLGIAPDAVLVSNTNTAIFCRASNCEMSEAL